MLMIDAIKGITGGVDRHANESGVGIDICRVLLSNYV